MNKTLQDRLVKELRLQGISNAEDANAFVPAFMDAYNSRFERAPRSLHNAHRPLLEGEDLNLIFTWQEDRKLSQSLVVQFQRNSYLVEPTTETSKLAGKTVRVHLWKDGQVQLRHNNQPLPFTLFDKSPHVNQGEIVENKRLGAALAVIQQQQQVRDEARLRSKKLTLRQKERLRAQRAEAESSAPVSTSINPAAAEAFANYLQEVQREQKARQRRYNENARLRRAAAREAALSPTTVP